MMAQVCTGFKKCAKARHQQGKLPWSKHHRMKLLFLTPQLPYPPRQGTALRNWGLISQLAQRHEVWLLSFSDAALGTEIHPTLQATCKQIATFPTPQRTKTDRVRTLLTSHLPDMGWRLWSPAFLHQLETWLAQEHFDIVQIEGIELARYALESSMGMASKPNGQSSIVFDDHNCEYQMQQRWFERDVRNPKRWPAAAYSFAQWRRLIQLERAMIRAADATLCVSPQDRESIRWLDPQIQPHVILNGIELATYEKKETTDDGRRTTVSQSSVVRHPSSLPPSPNRIVFTGKMDFRPNIDAMLWFGQAVWPAVKQQCADAKLVIVGQKPSPRLDVLRGDPSIELTGEVEDVRPYIAEAAVYVAPLRIGSGTRFKLLEAMALRKPIVSTTLGCEGFDITPDKEMVIADAAPDFARAVLDLLGNAGKQKTIGENAYHFVAATYDWSAIVPKLEYIYRLIHHR